MKTQKYIFYQRLDVPEYGGLIGYVWDRVNTNNLDIVNLPLCSGIMDYPYSDKEKFYDVTLKRMSCYV